MAGKPVIIDGALADGPGGTIVYRNGKWIPQSQDSGPKSTVATGIVNQDAKRAEAMAADADQVGSLASTSRDAIQQNNKTSSGGILGLPLIGQPIAHMLAASGLDPALGAMDSDALTMAKQLRAPGQRLTQMEWARNIGAVPNPGMAPDTNSEYNLKIQRMNVKAQAQNAFFQSWLHTHGSLAGADPAWQGYQAQHFNGDGDWSATPVNQPAPAAQPGGGWSYVGATPAGN